MLTSSLFTIFALLCIGGAVNLLIQRHPINSALSLITVMGSLALLYLLLGAEFVAAVQVIVYAGAIMVLFVFVIMLLNAGAEEQIGRQQDRARHRHPWHLCIGGLIVWLLSGYPRRDRHQRVAHHRPRILLPGCFTDFLLPFEITSVLLLIAIMGAVVISKKEH